MKFELTPISSINPMVVAKHKDQELNFPVRRIINRRLREPVNESKVFFLINEYIKYKGSTYQDKLFDTLKQSSETIEMEAFKPGLEPFPIAPFHNVLNMFDLEDIKNFLKKSKLITPPSRLGDVFDTSIELNEKGTRVQTYLKEDYMELIALLVALKSIFGLIGKYTALKSGLLQNNPYREYILLQLIITHPITHSEAFKKVFLSINKLVERVMSDNNKYIIRILEKNISRDAIPEYIMGKVIIERLFTNNELDDTNNKSTITKIYKYASNQLKSKSDVSNIKVKYYNQTSEDGESESNLESLRTPSNITMGNIQEFRVYASMPYPIMEKLGLGEYKKDFSKLNKYFTEKFSLYLPLEESIYITSWIVKSAIDPRCVFYLKINELINLITIAYLWLKKHELYGLAEILVSYQNFDSHINISSAYVSKIDPYVKNELDKYFPFKRTIISKDVKKEESFIETIIGKIYKNLATFSLKTLAEKEVVKKANSGTYSVDIVLPPDIKNQFMHLLIFLAEKDESDYRKLKSKNN